MKYEFDLHADRAELLKEEMGGNITLSKAEDHPKFIHVKIEINDNWDMLKYFHAGIEVGRKSMVTSF